jgi:hypothetical protein
MTDADEDSVTSGTAHEGADHSAITLATIAPAARSLDERLIPRACLRARF